MFLDIHENLYSIMAGLTDSKKFILFERLITGLLYFNISLLGEFLIPYNDTL